MKYNKSKTAFTLAETLIALTVLGIIAAITIPSLINKQLENAARAKIKKAMAAYEEAMNSIIMENNIKTNASLIGLNQEDCKKQGNILNQQNLGKTKMNL